MNRKLVDQVADAVMYEGYILYPYRPSVKNRQRWTFGGLYPRAYHEANGGYDAWTMQTQCLVESNGPPRLGLRVRFLHLVNRTVGRLHQPLETWPREEAGEPAFTPVDSMEIAGKRYQTWQEAVPREVRIDRRRTNADFSFPVSRDLEPLWNEAGRVVGVLVRARQAIAGEIELSSERIDTNLHRITAQVRNRTDLPNAASASRDDALMRSLVSTHMVLELDNAAAVDAPPSQPNGKAMRSGAESVESSGRFISLIDPPESRAGAVEACRNRGCYPVLVGEEGRADTMLASPIILYDYPKIAEQSPGDLFDGTEIDEILSLRIMTLTDEEKREAAANDDHAKALLERTESLARDELMNLHGQMRPTRAANPQSETGKTNQTLNTESETDQQARRVDIDGVACGVGDRVRLNPRRKADAFDLVLKGLTATIEKIERDFENRTHLAVTIDDDPGADFGRVGKPGHRFFFELDDVEPLAHKSGL